MSEGSPTWQSSDLFAGINSAHLAVDGIDNPVYRSGSCSHTECYNVIEQPVWAVDLGYLTDVYYVEVVNRVIFPGKHIHKEEQGWYYFCAQPMRDGVTL